MPTLYQVAEWEQFENNKSREREALSWYSVPNSVTPKLRRILKLGAVGAAYYAVHHLILGLCSRQTRPRAGWLTDDGTPSGDPLTAADLAREFALPERLIADAIEALACPRIGWLCAREAGTETGTMVPVKRALRRPPMRRESAASPPGEVPPEVEVEVEVEVENNNKNTGEAVVKAVSSAAAPKQTEAARGTQKTARTTGAARPEDLESESTAKNNGNEGYEKNLRHESAEPEMGPEEWRRWNVFAQILRTWGWGDLNTRRLVRYLRGRWTGAGTPEAGAFWSALCAIKFTQDRAAKPGAVSDLVSYAITLIEDGRDVRDHMRMARVAWEAAEKRPEGEPLAPPPDWLAEALAGVGR